MADQFRKIAQILLKDIRNGVYPVGKELPPRMELKNRFNVARATLEKALSLLINKGVLESRRGSGTKVINQNPPYRIAFVGPTEFVYKAKQHNSCQFEFIDYSFFENPNERTSIREYDGILWNWPDYFALEWIHSFKDKVPQILINRQVDELNYISTNHQEAVKRITLKRLEEFPESIPYFLKKTSDKSMLLESRETGFIEACRKKSRFYEIIKMPKEFDEKVATLDRTIPLDSSPIIMVSDTISSTGAVISWTKKNGLKFKKDLFYSDFDNNEELDIWGIRVTSFIQDYATLIDLAVNNLVKLIENKKAKVQELIFPEFIDGDT